jgi:LSD1 subclass zinc finger protein
VGSQLVCGGCGNLLNLTANVGARAVACPRCGTDMDDVGAAHTGDSSTPLTASCRGIFCLSCSALIDVPLEVFGPTICPRCAARMTVHPRKSANLPSSGPASSQENRSRLSESLSPQVQHPPVQVSKPPPRPNGPSKAVSPASRPVPPPRPASSKPSATRPLPLKGLPQTGEDNFASMEEEAGTPAKTNHASRQPPVRSKRRPIEEFNPDSYIESSSGQIVKESRASQPEPPASGTLDKLPTVNLWQNWRTSKLKLPTYLVKGRGRILDSIAQRFVQAIGREQMKGVSVVFAGGAPNVANANRPLRVISRIGPGHFGATDVTFRAEGNDLFVRFQSVPRTLITYLRIGLYLFAFLACYSLLMALYLYGTGAFDGWAADYAQKHSSTVFAGQDHHVFYKTCITDGHYIFDNKKFVSEMVSSWGHDLLLSAVKKETGGKSGMEAMFNGSLFSAGQGTAESEQGASPRNADTPPPSFEQGMQKMGANLALSVLDTMGSWGPAHFAVLAIQKQYNSNEYFWWFSPNANFVVMFNDVRGTDSLWYSKNVDFKSHFMHDFGNDDQQSKELSAKMTAAMNKSIRFVPPWNAARLFWADPKIAMLSLGGPSTIFAMLIGAGLFLLPMSILHWPCKALGWPTYEEFTTSVNARNAWVERVLSDMLMNDFGVQEQDRFTVMNQ